MNTEAALKEGADPQGLVMNYMVPAMDEVGNRFECNEYFVPELLIAARAMKTSLELIRPLLSEQGIEPIGRGSLPCWPRSSAPVTSRRSPRSPLS